MMRTLLVLLLFTLCGCASSPYEKPHAIVPSAYEPAAQFPEGKGGLNKGAVVGAAGGAAIGAASAQAAGGLLCTVGGPLCLIVMIPAAIVGGVLGGVTGGVVDAVTADPGNRIAGAKAAIEQSVADMRLTDALAAHMADGSMPLVKESDYRALAGKGIPTALEVEVIDLRFLPRDTEMAFSLQGRARLYRTADRKLLEERVSEAKTDFRRYVDWAADGGKPLRQALDTAVAELGRSLLGEVSAPRPLPPP